MRDKDTELLEEAYNNVLLNELNWKQTAALAGMGVSSLFPSKNAQASQPIQTANMSQYETEQSYNNVPRLFESEEKLKSLEPVLKKYAKYFGQNSAQLPFNERAELKAAVSKAYGITDPKDLSIVIQRDVSEFNKKPQVTEVEEYVMTALSYFVSHFNPSDNHRNPPIPR
jgi:hypothetical protein